MKTISVPISTEAMLRLDTDSCLPGDLREVELNQVEFGQLWESGLFRELNSQFGLNIDEFEDESIPLNFVSGALGLVERYAKDVDLDISRLKEIVELFKLAIDKSTGVFLFF
jgi:hypothetical protein